MSGPQAGGADAPEFDPAILDAFLKDRLEGTAGPMALARIAGGQSNPTFFVTYAGRRLVLRKQPPGELLPSAHAVDREYRIVSALAGTGMPVPPALLFCADRAVVGTPFYVMERVDGRVFHDCTLPGVEPAARGAMYGDMAKVLAALHNVDFAAIGLADFGRPGNYFARQIARWTRQWTLARTREDKDLDRVAAWLAANVPQDETTSIAHGDFRIGNLMFHPTEPRVVALLDWELSTLGHPLADLAHSAMAFVSLPEEYGGIRGLDLPALGIPDLDSYVAAYSASARHGAKMTNFHMAFALFRWSVIFEGIAARAKAGNAASADAARTGLLSAAFARRAAEFI
ncbi:phosphotransferase family protein [Xanthobacter sp. KR7-225]|uniref:phosphotransferase family protein n=1 Tax=Xanthobacter sp. KR7-225 TaxID=3156613 RepID=UPI0032B5652C